MKPIIIKRVHDDHSWQLYLFILAPKLEMTQMYCNEWVVKQCVVHPCFLGTSHEIIFYKKKKKGWAIDTHGNLDGSQRHEVDFFFKEPVSEVTRCMFLFLEQSWNDKMIEMENKVVVGGKGCGWDQKGVAPGRSLGLWTSPGPWFP